MSMNVKFSVENSKDIKLTFNRASLLGLINAMGLISKDAQKSASISWRQYKTGKAKVLNDANSLLAYNIY
jgi:hypothetical protein